MSVHFFDIYAKKSNLSQSKKKQISAKKTLECFLFQNEGYRIVKYLPRKVQKNSGNIQFDRKRTHSFSSSPTVFVGVKIVHCSTT